MKLNLRDVLASETLSIPFDYSIDLSAEEINFEFPFLKPIRVKGELKNKSDVFYLNAEASGIISTHCARCGKAIEKEKNLDVSFVIARSISGEGSDDIIVVESDVFDLDEIIREEIILNMDMVTLCDKNCKGVCPKCGQDLNEKDCDCPKREIDPRLAKLAQLLQDK